MSKKKILLSSHPDDWIRQGEIAWPEDGPYASSNIEVVGRHDLLESELQRPAFVKHTVRRWLHDVEFTVILATNATGAADPVADDIHLSEEACRAVVGVRLDGDFQPREDGGGVESAMWEGGYEVVDNDATEVEAAFARTKRLTKQIPKIRAHANPLIESR
jgi:hypothetical protein